jgi:rootletin
MSSPIPNETTALLRQNQELRQRLQDDTSNYRKKLDTYKMAQSNQAALVSRLQAKVLQYKQRCSELETQMHDTPPICPQYGDIGSKSTLPSTSHTAPTSTPIPSALCPKTGPSYSSAPLSLPCEQASGRHYSDESLEDESFERKRIEEERKL